MSTDKPFTKDNLDSYLRALAKEFRRLNGKTMPAEIILIGGASVLVNYGFREMTYDMDAIINSTSVMEDAINNIGNRFELPIGWLNTDFKNTSSYTPRLVQFSKYYKTFSNILQVRTITAEYLVAMKLMSGRQYKNDLSDVVGILLEQEKRGQTITLEMIKTAIKDLYDEYENIPENSQIFIETIYKQNDLEELYKQCRRKELENKDVLVRFEHDYPGVLKGENIADVIKAARLKKQKNGQETISQSPAQTSSL